MPVCHRGVAQHRQQLGAVDRPGAVEFVAQRDRIGARIAHLAVAVTLAAVQEQLDLRQVFATGVVGQDRAQVLVVVPLECPAQQLQLVFALVAQRGLDRIEIGAPAIGGVVQRFRVLPGLLWGVAWGRSSRSRRFRPDRLCRGYLGFRVGRQCDDVITARGGTGKHRNSPKSLLRMAQEIKKRGRSAGGRGPHVCGYRPVPAGGQDYEKQRCTTGKPLPQQQLFILLFLIECQ